MEAGPRLKLSNSYHPLAPTSVEESVKEESGSSSSSQRTGHQTALPTKAPPRTSPVKKVVPAAKHSQPPPTQMESKNLDFQAQQVYDRPYRASYFIPGKVEGRSSQFLLDTGCTTNLQAKHVFDRLPEHIRFQKQNYASHGLLADGTRLPFFGMIRLAIRLRQVKLEETFVVSQISEDAILRMPFLVEQGCAWTLQSRSSS